MDYSIALITPEFAREITTWTYDPPYDRYDMSVDNLQGLLNRDYRYHVVFDGDQTLLGFCCFGEDARVPGGTYSIIEPDILDVGVGIHPDILKFAFQAFHPESFRVTVAAFNLRSIKTFKSLGFIETHTFINDRVKIEFIQLVRSD